MNITINQIQDKFDCKKESITKCDDLFDNSNMQIDAIKNSLVKHLEITKDIVKKLELSLPSENSTTDSEANQSFWKAISAKHEEVHNHL